MALTEDLVLVGVTMLPNTENHMFVADKDGNLIGQYPTAANPQVLPHARIECSEVSEKNVYYNDVGVIDAMDTTWAYFPIRDLNHECIFGTNTPRYYTPAFDYGETNTNILLIRSEVKNEPYISQYDILDNIVAEHDLSGDCVWEWSIANHYDQLGLTAEERKNIAENNLQVIYFGEENDFAHLNCACELGENQWYDAGDERFKPENIMICSRHMSRVFIIEKETGNIVYTLNCKDSFDIVHQHYAHIIPKGLEGAGNILLYHGHSKTPCIIEINPVTLEVVFKHVGNFRSNGMGSVQKLPDGSYLVGASLRKKAVIVEKDGTEQDIPLHQIFYRINAIPKEWLEKKFEYEELFQDEL